MLQQAVSSSRVALHKPAVLPSAGKIELGESSSSSQRSSEKPTAPSTSLIALLCPLSSLIFNAERRALLAHAIETQQKDNEPFPCSPISLHAGPSSHESEGSTGSESGMLRVQPAQDRISGVTVGLFAAIEKAVKSGQNRLKPSLVRGFGPYLEPIHHTKQKTPTPRLIVGERRQPNQDVASCSSVCVELLCASHPRGRPGDAVFTFDSLSAEKRLGIGDSSSF